MYVILFWLVVNAQARGGGASRVQQRQEPRPKAKEQGEEGTELLNGGHPSTERRGGRECWCVQESGRRSRGKKGRGIGVQERAKGRRRAHVGLEEAKEGRAA